MTYNPDHRRRRSIRLRGYDYAQAGAYFITICAQDRACLFADIDAEDASVCLTPVGEVIAACWEAIPDHFPTVDLDAFVVMPNHIHGILVIGADPGAGTTVAAGGPRRGATGPPTETRERFGRPVAGSIPTIVRSFKAAVTKAVNDDPGRGPACRSLLAARLGPLPPGRVPSLWQRNYYEHVIRNERALDRLRSYVAANPARWLEDSLHPANPLPFSPTPR